MGLSFVNGIERQRRKVNVYRFNVMFYVCSVEQYVV
jgi:hypothetical protein